MDKVKKQEVIQQIKDLLDSSEALYLTDFTGMTVEQVNELRNEFYNVKINYKVVKNTLALRALKESSKYSGFVDNLDDFLKGPTGFVFAGEDPVAPARILKKYFSKLEKPKFKVAVVDNQFYGKGTLDELASLLSKEEVISAIMSSLDSSVSGIVGAINAVIRDLSSVIEEVAKNKAA